MENNEMKREKIKVEKKEEKKDKKGKAYYVLICEKGLRYNSYINTEIGKEIDIEYTESTYQYNGKDATSRWVAKIDGAGAMESDPLTPSHGEKLNEATLTDTIRLLVACKVIENNLDSKRLKAVYDQLRSEFRG
jgi:putative aminopeptidase FrvX